MKRIANDLPDVVSPARRLPAALPPVRVLAMRVPLAAPDLEASLAFYGALGLRTLERGVGDDDRRWALLALPGAPAAQLLLEECAPAEPIELRLEVESLRAALRALAPVERWAADRADSITQEDSVCITDPAGHPVVLSRSR
jgi:catechol 2,3-dioxygenase-like lactoylglutathione lyase family enzyme